MNLTGMAPPQLGNLSFLVSLDMRANNFHGDLPVEFSRFSRLKLLLLSYNSFTGQIPPGIGSLQELEILSLENNSFTGLIPPSISNMTKLASLNLAFNSFHGNIPAVLFNISSLELIELHSNRLSGSLPSDNLCQNLPRLSWLSVYDNELSGRIPSSIVQCARLQNLDLSFNKFTGSIPKEIGNLKVLELLSLAVNQLEGIIPKTIGDLTSLTTIDFGDINLTGIIPREIGNLTSLEYLYFGSTNITGVIPQELSNLYDIIEIDFGYDKLSGLIPAEMFNLSALRSLELGGNQFSGHIPSTMGYGLPNFERLYLDHNNFGGVIPESISNSSQLYIIELSENNFTGSIPTSLGNLRLLQILNFHNNYLTSDSSSQLRFIESLTNCRDLIRIGASANPLNGFLPDALGNLSTSFEMLFLDDCKLRGTIPSGIGNLSSLIVLYLSSNQLSGTLPNTIKDLQNIQELDLGGNKISISLQLLCDFQNLGGLNLRENSIVGSGMVPECLGNITSLRYLYLDSMGLSSSLPRTIWSLKDLLELSLSFNLLSGSVTPEIKDLNVATDIDLSENHFSGDIPSTIGDLVNLKGLLLHNNRLQGSIPESFGYMLSLEKLDLSHNLLSGSIPRSLEKLGYLRDFNVSFNNLSGEIPSGGPFTNFTAESFISNKALCGSAQRFHVPPCQSVSDHKLRNKKLIRIVLALSGVIAVVGAMSFGFFYLRHTRKGHPSNIQEYLSLTQHERISYYKLQQATEGYDQSNLLGNGSFGSVYKGTLEDGRIVAVKVFNLELERSFESFEVECEVLRNLLHRNLTKVISSCSNLDFKALILEYMPNGSLEKWLYSHNYFLNIIQRLEILIDVACALQYLHCENSIPVVHCDLKPSNVLLDQAMVAHVCDFGIAKLLGNEDSIRYTRTLPTLGYLAPEYGMEGLVSTKCDVYSFGIMMMEVFTRMSPNNEMFGEILNLKSWVEDSIPNGLAGVVDANLLRATEEHFPETVACISSIMKVALNCTKESPRERSNIRDVLAALNKIKLQLLPYKQALQGIREMV